MFPFDSQIRLQTAGPPGSQGKQDHHLEWSLDSTSFDTEVASRIYRSYFGHGILKSRCSWCQLLLLGDCEGPNLEWNPCDSICFKCCQGPMGVFEMSKFETGTSPAMQQGHLFLRLHLGDTSTMGLPSITTNHFGSFWYVLKVPDIPRNGFVQKRRLLTYTYIYYIYMLYTFFNFGREKWWWIFNKKRVSWYPIFKEILFPRKKLMDAVVEATGAGTVTVIGGLDRNPFDPRFDPNPFDSALWWWEVEVVTLPQLARSTALKTRPLTRTATICWLAQRTMPQINASQCLLLRWHGDTGATWKSYSCIWTCNHLSVLPLKYFIRW